MKLDSKMTIKELLENYPGAFAVFIERKML
jgi:hypothetical protein